jgi:Dockerin type I domain
MKASRLTALIFLGSLAIAAPVTYWVATTDGTPADFTKQVDTAFNAWKAVPSTTLKLEKNKDSSLQFNWNVSAEDVPINPDAITRTISSSSEDGKTTKTTVNVNPDQTENLESGLLIEAGLRLGVPLEASIEGKRSVGEVEAVALRAKFGQTGDLNGDQKVNLDDLEILATNYGKTGLPSVNLNGDFNGDGIVNDKDLEIMKATYSFEITPEKTLTPEPPANPTAPTKPETPTTPTKPESPTSPPASPTDPTTPPPTPTDPATPPTPTDPATPPTPTDPATPPTDPNTPPTDPVTPPPPTK